MVQAIAVHEENLRRVIEGFEGGLVVKTIGDATMFVVRFETTPTVSRVVSVARELGLALQKVTRLDRRLRFRRANGTTPSRFHIRIGMAFGQAQMRSVRIQRCTMQDYLGSVVNLASRMESKVCPVTDRGAFSLGFFKTLVPTDLRPAFHKAVMGTLHTTSRSLSFSVYDHHSQGTTPPSRSSRLLTVYHRDVAELKGVGEADVWTLQ
jgi:hypothetical protein